MTTIATDGKSMAGDGISQSCGTISRLASQKVWRLRDGTLLGSVGKAAWAKQYREWYEAGCEGDPPESGDDSSAILLLKPDGQLLMVSGDDGIQLPVETPWAIGSGMDLAIGAMEAGAKPKKAVEIAARRDPNTGGKIRSFTITK
jgi:hypothetical protein